MKKLLGIFIVLTFSIHCNAYNSDELYLRIAGYSERDIEQVRQDSSYLIRKKISKLYEISGIKNTEPLSDIEEKRIEDSNELNMCESKNVDLLDDDKENHKKTNTKFDVLYPIISKHCHNFGVPVELVLAIIEVESSWDAKAVSNKGAMGIMQLMPVTARELLVENPFDPESNISAGVCYLKELLDRFGNLELALAAYNAGPDSVEKYASIPPFPETKNFVHKVINRYTQARKS